MLNDRAFAATNGAPGAADPVLAAVIENRLHAIATQMAETMLLTSRSLIFQVRDFVTGIFTADGTWVATKDYIPVLAGSLPHAYEAVAKRFADDVNEGDVFILNDVYHGNNHAPDVTILKPVFHRGVLRFWAITKGHNADVGGGGVVGYNPYARDVWEDALRIPPVRISHRGELQRDVWELILLNIPLRALVESDFECQIGAASVGAQALIALLDNFGVEATERAVRYFIDASRRHMEAELLKLADGVYTAVRHIDDGGAYHREPVAFRLRLVKNGPKITLDFRESDPQVQGYANSSVANTVASSLIGVFGAIAPDIHRNSGSIAPIEVLTTPGTVAHAVEPAATTLCTLSACEAIVDAIWVALGEAAPHLTNAGWSHCWVFGASGVNGYTGRQFAAFVASGGGSGATEGFDGWDFMGTPVTMGGMRAADLELHELGAPTAFVSQEYQTDSAGPGRWRGGFGSATRWLVEQDGLPVVCYGSGTLPLTAPFGIRGGGGAAPNWGRLVRADGSIEDVPVNSIVTLNRGDVVEIRSAGGGGFGNPHHREAAAVVEDVRNGLVSPAAAREIYGVAINPDGGDVDVAVTAALRSAAAASSSTSVAQPGP
jgi:N-methylhydantoinase B